MMLVKSILSVLTFMLTANTLFAEDLERIGKPKEGGISLQNPVTELARDIIAFDTFLLYIITFIVMFVTALLVYVVFKFNKDSNPTPSNTTHNTPIEVAWTIVPILLLLFIGTFSLPVLFKQQTIPDPDITIKVTGYQWYWGYEYPDDGVAFESYMLEKDELESYGYSQDEYLLATDTRVIVPIGKVVQMQVTAADVIHSWAMPAFGVKQDGIPGRLASLWFKAEKEGLYFGQCSELCGSRHAYMPITVQVVSENAYKLWLEKAKEEYPL